MKCLTAALVLMLSISSFAGSQKVMQITNDIDTNLVTISIEDLDQSFKNIRKIETTADKKVLDNSTYNLTQLYAGPAMQIIKNREVVKIRFNKNFDPVYGGPFVLDYLYSGISGERKSLVLDLRKNGSKWEVTLDNKIASKLHVIGNKKTIIGVIGIASIKVLN